MLNGVVIKAFNSYYYVQTEDIVTRCTLRGRFKKERFSLTVGDQVEYVLLSDGKGIIEQILSRHSLLKRPLVANVNQVIITFAAANPDLNTLLLDRFLVLAEYSRIEILICINKMDLANQDKLKTLLASYKHIGYAIVEVSSNDPISIERLRTYLKDKISVFAGPSGVGKSTLLNRLEPGLKLSTGLISEKIKRGKHTTRVAELLPLSQGGFVVDTPGFSFTEFDYIEKNELTHFFPEFNNLQGHCKYNTCLHSHEPQCTIKQAVENGIILEARYQSYLNILNEIQTVKKEF